MCALFVASWRKIYLFSNRRTYQHLPDFNVILCFVPGCVCVCIPWHVCLTLPLLSSFSIGFIGLRSGVLRA